MKEKESETELSGNISLSRDISRVFNSFFGDVLNILSSRFPFVSGDGSENEMQFLCLRSKILRCGNNKLRTEIPEIISQYESKKMFNIEKKVIQVGQKVK